MVDGQRVAGRFHKVGFADGENVEFVGEMSGNTFAAMAARSLKQRLIWMLPYHERGELAHRSSNRKWSLLTSGIGAGLFCGFMLWNGAWDVNEPLWLFPTVVGFFFIICLGVNIFARSFFTRYGYAATPILEAFGFANPAKQICTRSTAQRERKSSKPQIKELR